MRKEKVRLDLLLTETALCKSRAEAQALIIAGKVRINGVVINKPGTLVLKTTANIEIADRIPFVSRGGLKLKKAMTCFSINVSGLNCLDVGASTGGFTDCLLQNGASHVAAIDVGYGQLDWKLRNDERVQVLEKTNIRTLQPQHLRCSDYTLGVCDTSFISLKKVLPHLVTLLNARGQIIALLKPQFEFKDYITDKTFKGVVKQPEQHLTILTGVYHDLAKQLPDWQLSGANYSPITGPKGNIEYLLYYTHNNLQYDSYPFINAVETLIQSSHAEGVL